MAGEPIPTPRGGDPQSLRNWGMSLVAVITRRFALPVRGESFTVATLPPADADRYGEGTMIYVSDETGGGVMAFSDGTDWRRVTDRAVVS